MIEQEHADIILKAFLGSIAMILYAVWKVRDHLRDFSFGLFFNENKLFWAWSIIVLYSVLLIVTLHPPAAVAIKTMIGLDVNDEPTSFLMLGWGLSALVNNLNPKKIDKK